MEALVTIVAVGAYAERQYQKQDGSSEYFKSRGVTMKRGGDVIYGEMTGEPGLEEPRHAVPTGDALYREGLLEAPHLGRLERSP